MLRTSLEPATLPGPEPPANNGDTRLTLFGRRRHRTGLAAIGMNRASVCVAGVDRNGSALRVTTLDYRSAGGDAEARSGVLDGLRRAHGLGSRRCATLLGSTEYQLLLTDAPDVPREELRAALRWQIKDLLTMPVEQAALDVFELPPAATGGRRSLYAVAASAGLVHERVELFGRAGIEVEIVDIPELAQRNLAMLLAEDRQGVLMVGVEEDGALLTVTRNGELYLARRFNSGADLSADDDGAAAARDRLVLEVQRSLDYYDSHYRQDPVAAVVVATDRFDPAPLVEFMAANLGVQVVAFDPAAALEWSVDLPRGIPPGWLATLGLALRHEERAL